MNRKKLKFDMLEPNVPLIFTDGSSAYRKLGERHVQHKVGYFILGPSGSGKTHFIKRQKQPHWMDGDELWMTARAHPDSRWWLEKIEVINEIDQRSDIITVEAKKLGFWIIGASNYWLRPDAIVLPNWSTHKKYISLREHGDYDGGATTKELRGVLGHRRTIAKWKKYGVPCFKSVDEAAQYLSKNKVR